jgi:hypothetical protein
MNEDKEAAISPRRSASVDSHSIDNSKTPSVAEDARRLYELYHQGTSDDGELASATANKVLRKIDVRVLPMLIFTYFLQFLDKSGINYASVYGLQKGTNLHGQDYAWLGE